MNNTTLLKCNLRHKVKVYEYNETLILRNEMKKGYRRIT